MLPEKREVEVGKPLTIVFDAVAVHYQWTHEASPDLTVTVRDITQELEGDNAPIGAGPRREFTVVANKPGQHDLVFNLAPVWSDKPEERKPYWIFANAPK